MKIIVDVREPNEYGEGHVSGAMNLPLSSFDEAVVAELCRAGNVQLVCTSGMRAGQARDRILQKFPELSDQVSTGVGSDSDPAGASGPPIPIIRQVLLIAGSMVAAFGLLAVFANPLWLWGAVGVGCGLAFAGATGICGMARLLELMPFNRRKV